jgi:competence protein ComEC
MRKVMKRLVSLMLVAFAIGVSYACAKAQAQDRAGATLDIYVIDPEGGKVALWIAPSGETVLIDTGSPGGRDVGRLKEVLAAANVKRIDFLISTHYHSDHVGGLQELVKEVPVGTFVDHGPTVEGPVDPNLREHIPGFQTAYAELWRQAKHLVVKPGDRLPVNGLTWEIVASAGATLRSLSPARRVRAGRTLLALRRSRRTSPTIRKTVNRSAASSRSDDSAPRILATCSGTKRWG